MKYPALRFSFAGGDYTKPNALKTTIAEQLDDMDEAFGYSPESTSLSESFTSLLLHVNQQTGQRAVVLVDAYDRPAINAIQTPELAKANSDTLSGFFGSIKDNDAYIEFSFFVGVCKISTASIFSGLNNLDNISMSKRHATLCGFTHHEVDTVFAAELEGLDRDEIREWYDGYNWLGESVYNPVELLELFKRTILLHAGVS